MRHATRPKVVVMTASPPFRLPEKQLPDGPGVAVRQRSELTQCNGMENRAAVTQEADRLGCTLLQRRQDIVVAFYRANLIKAQLIDDIADHQARLGSRTVGFYVANNYTSGTGLAGRIRNIFYHQAKCIRFGRRFLARQ